MVTSYKTDTSTAQIVNQTD